MFFTKSENKSLKETMSQSDVLSISLAEYEQLTQRQCPMPPRKYKYINSAIEECSTDSQTTAWYYKGKFWIKERGTDKVYAAILKPKEAKKYKDRINCMRTVDEYLSGFHLTSSVDIYQMLNTAINMDAANAQTHAAIKGKAGKMTNAVKYAKKFTPTWKERLGLLTIIFRAVLNAYFIVSNFVTFTEVPAGWRVFVLIVVSIEAILWLIAFLRTMYNLQSLLKRVCTGSTTHFQVKNVPDNLRQLGSLSVMRYLPSGEQLGMAQKRGKEWWRAKKASYTFEVSNARNFKFLVRIRWLIMSILDVIGPVVAIFSLLFKMAQVCTCYVDHLCMYTHNRMLASCKQLNFQFDGFDDLTLWALADQIIRYFAFVNQGLLFTKPSSTLL